jgi:hypothetical protein
MISSTGTGSIYNYWGVDASLSPALLLLLAGGALACLFRRPDLKAPLNKKRLVAEICLVLAIWVTIEFTLAKGIIYPLVRNLPILASLRGNVRNISGFIFPLAVVGAVIFDRWTKNWKSGRKILAAFLLVDGLALGSLLFFHWVPTAYAMDQTSFGHQQYQCDYRPILATYDMIHYDGDTFPITKIIPDATPWMVFQDRASSLIDPYNTFFKVLSGIPATLHPGSVYDIRDGYYNMIDPTGYLFPEVNHSSMFSRIPVEDKAKLDAFVNRRQPDWKLPILQQVLDWVSLISLIGVFVLLAFYLIRSLILNLNRNHVQHPG